MKQIYFLVVLISCPLYILAQNFSLVGTRQASDFHGWSLPVAVDVNQNSSGDFYIYIDESQSPRNPELVKFNAATQSFDDLTNNALAVPAQSTTDGVVMDDGSVYMAMRSFDDSYYAYKILNDGTLEDLGPSIPSPNSGGIETGAAFDSNGVFYAAGSLNSSWAAKYENNVWTVLPTPDSFPISQDPVIHGIELETDENNALYAAFAERPGANPNVTFTARVRKLASGATTWETIFAEAETSNDVDLTVVSSTEVYVSYTVNGGTEYRISKFDGVNTTVLGQNIPFDFGSCGKSDVIKLSSNNTLYFSNCADIYEYSESENLWVALPNNIADNGAVTSYADRFFESNDGTLINVLGFDEFSIVEYTPDNLGVVEYENLEGVSLYPNPTADVVQLTAREGDIELVRIFNMDGQLLEQLKVEPTSSIEVDLSNQTEGVYIISINGKESHKVIKK